MKHHFLKLATVAFAALFFTSCALTLPSFRKNSQSTEVNISNASAQVEPLKRDEYDVLHQTNGKAATSQFYLLFIPIGRHKNNTELYENAYYDAVDNLPGADGILLPRQKVRKLVIPLLVVNYYRRSIEVSGVGISIKGKSKTGTQEKK